MLRHPHCVRPPLLLVVAGFAPVFRERPLQDPALASARTAIDLVLRGHEPYPALAIDRHWSMVAANAVVPRLAAGADPSLLQPPVNVLRLSLHPKGMAPRIANLAEWRAHLLERLRRQIDVSADPVLVELLEELQGYEHPRSGFPPPLTPPRVVPKACPRRDGEGNPAATAGPAGAELAGVVVPLRLVTDAGTLSLFSTTTVFGTPIDVTLSELALECFYPADTATAQALRALVGQ